MLNLHRTMTALRDKKKSDEGFTLIELLVVVLIIGVLAAIAIPIFLTQQNQAREASVKADLANAKVAYVSSVVSGTVPSVSTFDAAMTASGFTASPGNTLTLAANPTATVFCIAAVNTAGGGTWHINANSGALTGGC